jgi:hypothetical protein
MSSVEVIQATGVSVAAVALLVNGAFHWLRYRHDKSSRSISASIKLVEEWRSLAGRQARAKIRTHLTGKNAPCAACGVSGLREDLREDVKAVSYLCDEIGARVVYGEANPMLIDAFLGHSIAKMWCMLKPYILAERRNQGFPLFQSHFEAIASKTSLAKIHKQTRVRIRGYVGFLVYRKLAFSKAEKIEDTVESGPEHHPAAQSAD